MTISGIESIAEGTGIAELAGMKSVDTTGSFNNWLNREMGELNRILQNADIQVQQLATGEQDNLHQVMLSLEKAKVGFELMVQVRNKLLEGYQEIMRMQV